MKIKTSELTGATLDWAVCRAQNPYADMSATHVWLETGDGEDDFLIDTPSTDWSQGGQIIEWEKISVMWGMDAEWHACTGFSTRGHLLGATPLIAAMRAYVVSKLGDEIEVPDELV